MLYAFMLIRLSCHSPFARFSELGDSSFTVEEAWPYMEAGRPSGGTLPSSLAVNGFIESGARVAGNNKTGLLTFWRCSAFYSHHVEFDIHLCSSHLTLRASTHFRDTTLLQLGIQSSFLPSLANTSHRLPLTNPSSPSHLLKSLSLPSRPSQTSTHHASKRPPTRATKKLSILLAHQKKKTETILSVKGDIEGRVKDMAEMWLRVIDGYY